MLCVSPLSLVFFLLRAVVAERRAGLATIDCKTPGQKVPQSALMTTNLLIQPNYQNKTEARQVHNQKLPS
jgi:hypothetical protein